VAAGLTVEALLEGLTEGSYDTRFFTAMGAWLGPNALILADTRRYLQALLVLHGLGTGHLVSSPS
jgi:hypothetical protein